MEFCNFVEHDHSTWQKLYANLDYARKEQAHPLHTEGLKVLGIGPEHIPSMADVNRKLKEITGWKVVPAAGLVDGGDFFKGLANKEFPVGNFIRDQSNLAYTPAPDVFHDLYGHVPFFADKKYADFCQRFGQSAMKHGHTPERLRQYERAFWFGVEFPLINTDVGARIFGGGILSSYNECNYSLGTKPKKIPFDMSIISAMEYRIDIMQETLFVLDSEDQLYDCINDLERFLN